MVYSITFKSVYDYNYQINYRPQNQLSLKQFKHPFETQLDIKNRRVVLANLIPWDELAKVFCQKLDYSNGRQIVDVRSVIASMVVKLKLRLDDQGTIEMISENLYLQYFCGLKEFTLRPVFDPSLFVMFCKRMGGQ